MEKTTEPAADIRNPRCAQLEAASGAAPGDELKTLKVVIITLLTMILEISCGIYSGSMALLADGWHMGTHAFALGISYAAFRMARVHARSGVFSFGTGKFSVLSGYTSSLFLGAAGVWMMAESFQRILSPVSISYGEALGVSVFGLAVNILCIFILGARHHDEHEGRRHEHEKDEHDAGRCVHEHRGGHHKRRHDHNYTSAYLHVLADALTSVLAIAALLCGMLMGWWFFDPLTGALGGIMILRWAWNLVRETGAILLDAEEGGAIRGEIIKRIESDNSSSVKDLHVWRIGSHDMAALTAVTGDGFHTAQDYKKRLADLPDLLHVSVEILDHRELGEKNAH